MIFFPNLCVLKLIELKMPFIQLYFAYFNIFFSQKNTTDIKTSLDIINKNNKKKKINVKIFILI